jgi:hypothetical protein
MSDLNFVLIFCFHSLPNPICNLICVIGRYLFLCSLTQLTLRQLIKYLYIFHWNYATRINDDFAALFLLLANFLLCLVFIFVTYFFGHNNAELNFHYCTGCRHTKNIEDTLTLFRRHGNFTITPLWFQTSVGPDPLDYTTFICLFVLIFITLQTWCYNQKANFISIWTFTFLKLRIKEKSVTRKPQSFEAESFNLEAGQTFGIILLGILFITPAAVVKSIARVDDNSLNYGYGRIGVYVTHLTVFSFYLNVFPLWIIMTNTKMLISLKRELKESRFVKSATMILKYFLSFKNAF